MNFMGVNRSGHGKAARADWLKNLTRDEARKLMESARTGEIIEIRGRVTTFSHSPKK